MSEDTDDGRSPGDARGSDRPSLADVWDDDRDVPPRAPDLSRRSGSGRSGSRRAERGSSSDGRQRVRKRVARRRPRRWPWVVLTVVVLLVAGVAVLGLDALAVQRHLTQVRGDVVALQEALTSGDADEASRLAEAAGDGAADAAARSDGPLWTVAGVLPVIGDDVRTVARLADLAVEATTVAEQAVRTATPLLAGELAVLAGPQRLDLDLFATLDAAVDRLDLDRLREAVDRVRDVPEGGLVQEVAVARAEALELSDRAVDGLGAADVALDLLPDFFGADGPRRYLLGLQTNAELRGTGGLMTYFSVVEARGGRLDIGPALRENELVDDIAELALAPASADPGPDDTTDDITDDADDLPTDGATDEPTADTTEDPGAEPATDAPTEQGTELDVPPTPTAASFAADASDAFAQRYDHLSSRSDYGNVNVDPDLTVVGPVLTQIAEATSGSDYDGVIMLDPIGLQQLLAGGEPLPVPAALSVPPLPNPIPVDQLAQVLLVDNYNVLGGDDSAARQPYLKAVAQAAITRVFADATDAGGLLERFGEAVATRHLQVHASRQVEGLLFDALGAGGRMTRPQDGTDVLAVTANNAAADKKDVHVTHRISGRFDLVDVRLAGDADTLNDGERAHVAGGADVLATRTGSLTVEMVNPLRPRQFDDYIVGSTPIDDDGEVGRPPRDPSGPARTWFTIWNPAGFGARQLTVDDERVQFGSGVIHDLNATDYFLEVPLEDTSAFTADLLGPVGMVRDGDELVYTLTLWRQAKAIPDVWDLEIRSPSDLVVSGATITGGGTGRTGFGPDQPGPLQLDRSDTSVRITGGATEDAVVELRFALP